LNCTVTLFPKIRFLAEIDYNEYLFEFGIHVRLEEFLAKNELEQNTIRKSSIDGLLVKSSAPRGPSSNLHHL